MVGHGRAPFHTHDDPDHLDKDIRAALQQALGERRIRLTDRRLLILYVINVVAAMAGAFLLTGQQAASDEDREIFQEAIVRNCLANQQNTKHFNAFIDTILETVQDTDAFTSQEKRQRTKLYLSAKGEVPECPPGALRTPRARWPG